MLRIYGRKYSRKCIWMILSAIPPDLDKWHRRCYTILEKLLPTSSRMVAFARHVCDGLGLYYPTQKNLTSNIFRT